MKTKRRHELQTNELADWLGNHIESIKPYLQYIVGGVIALVAIIGVIIYQTAGAKEQKAQAWRAYLAAMSQRSTSDLEEVATQYPKSVAALWALRAAGDIYLDDMTSSEQGVPLIYADRETAKETLEKAKAHYQSVLSRVKPTDTLLKQRSEFSLAQTYELLSELEEAKAHYSNVAETSPDSMIGQLAARSAERLNDPIVQDIYKQLSGEFIDPKSEYPDLPDRPDLSFPDLGVVAELSVDDSASGSAQAEDHVSTPGDSTGQDQQTAEGTPDTSGGDDEQPAGRTPTKNDDDASQP